MLLKRSQRLGQLKGAPRALDDRSIDKLAAEGYGTITPRIGLFERLDDSLGVVDFFGRRAEHLIDGIDLRRVNQRHGREAETARLPPITGEAFRIFQIDPDPIDRLNVSRRGRDDHGGAGVKHVARLALAGSWQSQLTAKIFRAEHQAADAG